MRTRTAAENTVLQAAHRSSRIRVLIEDAGGVLRDFSTLGGRDRIVGVEWGESQDQTVSSATVTLRREVYGASIATLMTGSSLNQSAGQYAPAIDVGRDVVIQTATVARGATPAASDWKTVWAGIAHAVDTAAGPHLRLECQDPGRVLNRRQIRDETVIGAAGGTPLATAMQELLDKTMGTGVVPLRVVGAAPAFMVNQYKQQPGSLGEALRTLALLIGWDVRYAWSEADGAFRLTLSEPNRAKTAADWTFGPSRVLGVSRLSVSDEDVRNRIRVTFVTAAGAKDSREVSDAASIAKYGEQFAHFTEGDESPIDTAAEATDFANAALKDLRDPAADMEAEVQYFWPVQLGDLLTFAANARHFDTNTSAAVVRYRHRWTQDGKRRTSLTVRLAGVLGAYSAWLRRSVEIADPPPPAQPPRAVPTRTALTASAASWSIGGVVGEGGAGPVSLRVETLTSATVVDWSASPVAVNITRDARDEVVYRVRVRDAAGLEGDSVEIAAPPTLPAVGPSGRVRPDEPLEGGNDFPEGRRGGALRGGSGGRGFREGDERSGFGGVPGALVHTIPILDGDGLQELISPRDRRVRGVLGAPNGTGFTDVEDGGNRGRTGLTTGGVVNLNVPRMRAAAELPSISTTDGRLLDTVAISGKSSFPLDTGDDVEAMANGATVADGSARARTGLSTGGVVGLGVPLNHAVAQVPAISSVNGRLLDTVEISGKASFPVDTLDPVSSLSNGATVEDGSARGRAGLTGTGVVNLGVPRGHARAELPAISGTDGRLLDTVEISGKTSFPIDTADSVGALSNGASVEDGSARARSGLSTAGVVGLSVPRGHAVANVPAISTTEGLLIDTQPVAGKATVYPVATDDSVASLSNGATVEDGATRARAAVADTTGRLAAIAGGIKMIRAETDLARAAGTDVSSVAQAEGGAALFRFNGAPSGTMWFGPHWSGAFVGAGDFLVIYRLKASANSSNSKLLRLDVTRDNSAVVLAGLDVRASDFAAADTWQDFVIRVRIDYDYANLEFRGIDFVSGVANVFLDYIKLVPLTGHADAVVDSATRRITTQAEARGGGKADATLVADRKLHPSTVVETQNVARGMKRGSAAHGNRVTFGSPAFPTTPHVWFGPGGLSYHPDLNTTPHGPVVEALNLDAGGFDVRAILRAAVGTITAREALFSGEYATKSTEAVAWDDRYTFHYSVTVQAGVPSQDLTAPRNPSSITLYFYSNDGSGEVLRATRSYSNDGTGSITAADTLAVTVGLMGTGDTFRILVAATEGNGGSVSRTKVTWGEAATPAERTMGTVPVPFTAMAGT